MNNIIIKKFGGTSLTNLNRVAHLIKNDVEKGCNVVVVVSAIAGFTDKMAFRAKQISNFIRSSQGLRALLYIGLIIKYKGQFNYFAF